MRASHQYTIELDERGSGAELRTWNGNWVADARILPTLIGEHATRDDAKDRLIVALKELINKLETEA